jgi:hypothetical protein
MSNQQKRQGTRYRFITIGSRTERGGRVSTGRAGTLAGLEIACVGDIVTYSDGAEVVIMDGAGHAATFNDSPCALVGSRLSNGDRIIETLWDQLDFGIFVEDSEQVEDLFDPDRIAPARETLHRFAVCDRNGRAITCQ